MVQISLNRNGIIVLFIIANLTGCTNPYAVHYMPFLAVESKSWRAPIKVRDGGKLEEIKPDIKRYKNKGYKIIGVSAFTDSKPQYQNMQAHAKKVGADIVVYYKTFAGSEKGTVPIILPSRREKIVKHKSGNVSGSVFGQGDPIHASGRYSELEVIYLPKKSNVVHVPYSRSYFHYGALYLLKPE